MKNLMQQAIVLTTAFLAVSGLAAKPVAYIYAVSGADKVSITKGNQTIKAAKYLNLEENTVVKVPDGAGITVFLASGKKIAFDQKAHFKITAAGIEPLDGETRALIEAKGEVLVRPLGGSRTDNKTEIPEMVKRELEAIDKNVADPAARSLLKIECYNKFGLKSRAHAEFDNYKKITGNK